MLLRAHTDLTDFFCGWEISLPHTDPTDLTDFFCGWEISLPHTDPTDLTGFSFVGGKSHGCSPLLCFLGLTRISQISQGFPLWVGNLTEALRSFASYGSHGSHGSHGFFCGICGLELIFWEKWWGNRQKVRNFTF